MPAFYYKPKTIDDMVSFFSRKSIGYDGDRASIVYKMGRF